LAKVTERGWHALCEKPFASSTDDHCQILDGAGRSGLKLGAGYMRRYYWAVEQAREMLRTNVLGQLIEILASEPASLDRTGLDQSSYRNSTSASGGGVLFETGCHLLDEVMSVSDAERVDLHSCEQKIWNDYEVETVASGILTRGTGEEVALQFIVSGVRPVYQGITFRCEGGKICLRLDPSKSLEMYIGPSQHQLEIRHPNPQQKHLLVAFRREWLDFLEACQSGSDWDQNKMTGLLTTQVIMQCGDLTRESPKRSFSAVNR
jgi:predicted dehydrogenase